MLLLVGDLFLRTVRFITSLDRFDDSVARTTSTLLQLPIAVHRIDTQSCDDSARGVALGVALGVAISDCALVVGHASGVVRVVDFAH